MFTTDSQTQYTCGAFMGEARRDVFVLKGVTYVEA